MYYYCHITLVPCTVMFRVKFPQLGDFVIARRVGGYEKVSKVRVLRTYSLIHPNSVVQRSVNHFLFIKFRHSLVAPTLEIFYHNGLCVLVYR